MSTQNKTENLKLPQYQPTDLFDLQEINEAYKSIDELYGTVVQGGAYDSTARLEIQSARKGKNTLREKIDEIDASLDTIANVNAKLLGFKAINGFDNTPILKNLIDNNFDGEITFPSGTYEFSEMLITKSIRIKGVANSFSQKATTFSPLTTNQRFIFKIGGDINYNYPTGNILNNIIQNGSIIDIVFSDGGKPTINNMLELEFIVGWNIGVTFNSSASSCLGIRCCWELEFEKFSVRDNTNNKHIIEIKDIVIDGYSNTSCLLFKLIDVEGIDSQFLNVGVGSNLTNINIETFNFEDANHFNKVKTVANLSEYSPLKKLHLFNIGYCDGLTIGVMNLHGFNKRSFIINGNETMFNLFNITGFVNMSVSNININDGGGYCNIIDGVGSKYSNVNIDNITSSLRNRVYNATNELVQKFNVFAKINTGLVNIKNTNANLNITNDDMTKIEINKLYNTYDLSKIAVIRKDYTNFVNSEKSKYPFVLSREGDYATLFKTIELTKDLEVSISLMTNATQLIFERSKITGEITSETININTPNAFTEYNYKIRKDGYDYLKIKVNTGNLLLVESVHFGIFSNEIQYGTYTPAAAQTGYDITFSKPFPSTPKVFTTCATSDSTVVATVFNISNTKFTLVENNTKPVNWMAIL